MDWLPPIAALAFPEIDPVLLRIGPLAIRWYALAYVVALLLGWQYTRRLNARYAQTMRREDIDDLLVWVTLGVLLGGRAGYVLFYNLPFYLEHPLAALAIWQGGMSFHGGLIGVVLATMLFARRRDLSLLAISDLLACATPIGLLLGRLANFINGELYGRPSDLPWAMVFPGGGPVARHPSQLYEALLEGLVLLLLLYWLARQPGVFRHRGALTGIFLVGYATARTAVELVREPDAQIGLLAGGSTMGQWLSLPMAVLGVYLIWRARKPTRDRPA